MENNRKEILKVIVGSVAHGLANKDSDTDYRSVYVLPTSEILSLNYKYSGSHWVEGESVDCTSYEIGHFLFLATKCNPSILEVMVAPVVESRKYIQVDREIASRGKHSEIDLGQELRDLLPYCWSPQYAFDAFTGYSLNQQKKMLANHLDRWQKYACAYLRTLANLIILLETGTFTLKVDDNQYGGLLRDQITNIKENRVKPGWVIDEANIYLAVARRRLENCKHEADHTKVNDFLLKVRKQFWN